MVAGAQGTRQHDANHGSSASDEWHQERAVSLDDARRVIEKTLLEMARRSYGPEAQERVRLEMDEAVRSALEHSQRLDRSRPILIGYRVGNDYALVEVEGRERSAQEITLQGPHAAEALRPTGEETPFGARSYTWVRCSRGTDHLLVCKYLSVP